MREFADTSFLVSLYVPDANHPAAATHASNWRQPPLLPLTPFGAFELNNTLRRLVFLGLFKAADLRRLARRVREDLGNGVLQDRPLEGYRLIQEGEEVSRHITSGHGTRALDVLHIAAARLHRCTLFLSFDKNQRLAARAAGLTVGP